VNVKVIGSGNPQTVSIRIRVFNSVTGTDRVTAPCNSSMCGTSSNGLKATSRQETRSATGNGLFDTLTIPGGGVGIAPGADAAGSFAGTRCTERSQ
jgi:hypothetical protein